MTQTFLYQNGRIQFELVYHYQPKEPSTGTALTFTLESVRAVAVKRQEGRGAVYPIHSIMDYDLSEAIGELEERRLSDPEAWKKMCDQIEAHVDEPDIPVDMGYVAAGRWA